MEHKDEIRAILDKLERARDSAAEAAEDMRESAAAWNRAHAEFIEIGANNPAKFAAEQASLSTEAARTITKICNANDKIWTRAMSELGEDADPTP